MNQRPRPYPILFFIAAIALLVAYHALAYIGHYGYDDMEYARLAVEWIRGNFEPQHHFSYRSTVLFFTALSYTLFGINDMASALPAMCVTAVILWLVYRYLRPWGVVAVAGGLGLTLLSNWFIFYSDKLMPDVYVALSVLAAVLIAARARFSPTAVSPWRYSLLLVLALFFGFLSKGTIMLALPLFAVLCIADLVRKHRQSFWLWSMGWGAVVAGCYLLGSYIVAGSPWARFDALYANSYLSLCSYDQQPVAMLIERITSGFFQKMASDGMLTAYLLILPVLCSPDFKKVWRMSTPLHFFVAVAFVLLLSANFMSISLTSYSPMCPDPRHYLFLVPVAGIAGGLTLERFIAGGRWHFSLAVVGSAAAVGSVWLGWDKGLTYYLPLAALFVLWWLLPKRPGLRPWWLAALWLVLAVIPYDMVRYAQQVQYRSQRDAYQKVIIQNSPDWYVVSDPISTRLGAYYGGFESDLDYTLLEYGSFDWDTLDNRKKVWYDNRYHQSILSLQVQDLPLYARSAKLREEPIFEDAPAGVRFVELDASSLVSKGERLWLHSLHDFEGDTPQGWEEATEHRTQSDVVEGSASTVRGFSATFRTSLDSLWVQEKGAVEVWAQVRTLMPRSMQTLLVIAVEVEGAAVIWESASVDRFTKAYGHWWPAALEVALEKDRIPPGARLVVYVWNQGDEDMFIDDFEVKIYRGTSDLSPTY